jgi:hypothetical protein
MNNEEMIYPSPHIQTVLITKSTSELHEVESEVLMDEGTGDSKPNWQSLYILL